MKFRYVMCGSFKPERYIYRHNGTDHRRLMIDIPMPFARETKEEAEQDSHFACRFMFSAEMREVVFVFYPHEGLEKFEDINGKPTLKVWVEGEPCYYMTYAEFKQLGGILWEMPSRMVCKFIPGSSEAEMLDQLKNFASQVPDDGYNIADTAVDVTFNELFPSLTPEDGPVYIDNESYCIVDVP